jgi:ribosomal protein S1
MRVDYANWGRLLSERFPARDPAQAEREWLALQRHVAIGQSVTGTVVTKAPFGAWIDLGIGFPALLEINCIAGLTPEKYRADDWCPIGSEVTAFVGEFRDRGHQVYLWQVRPGEQKHSEA